MVSIGPYDVIAELGRGGMGRVLRARHRESGLERALKVLDGHLDPEAVARFRREAEVLARAAGEGVVRVHDFGTDGSRLYFAMPILTGGSLRDRLKALRGGSVPWREAASLVARLARTLDRCHALGLVHRDVKPENVLFDERGEPQLTDFGCVRDLAHGSLTETGTYLGTPAYMAPEQLNGEKVDARADVFALGAILYELLAGLAPHGDGGPAAVFREIGTGRRRPLGPEVPPSLAALVEHALVAARARRVGSARLLADRLERLLATDGRDSLARPAGRRVPTSRALLAALAVVSVALGAIAVRAKPPERARPSPAPVVARSVSLDAEALARVHAALRDGDPAAIGAALEGLDPERRHPEAVNELRTVAAAVAAIASGRLTAGICGSLKPLLARRPRPLVAALVEAACRRGTAHAVGAVLDQLETLEPALFDGDTALEPSIAAVVSAAAGRVEVGDYDGARDDEDFSELLAAARLFELAARARPGTRLPAALPARMAQAVRRDHARKRDVSAQLALVRVGHEPLPAPGIDVGAKARLYPDTSPTRWLELVVRACVARELAPPEQTPAARVEEALRTARALDPALKDPRVPPSGRALAHFELGLALEGPAETRKEAMGHFEAALGDLGRPDGPARSLTSILRAEGEIARAVPFAEIVCSSARQRFEAARRGEAGTDWAVLERGRPASSPLSPADDRTAFSFFELALLRVHEGRAAEALALVREAAGNPHRDPDHLIEGIQAMAFFAQGKLVEADAVVAALDEDPDLDSRRATLVAELRGLACTLDGKKDAAGAAAVRSAADRLAKVARPRRAR